MITYNDLYEVLRREKYAEQLQPLPKDFVEEIATFLREQKEQSGSEGSSILEGAGKNKKQFENSIAIFKELILRRKKKLLNLVFVATETGTLKKDYEHMLLFEKEMFDTLLKTFESGDKALYEMLHGAKSTGVAVQQSKIIFSQNTEQFVDMSGNVVGPFKSGETVSLDGNICSLLVSSGKAHFVDLK